jgi:hypothetical protein
VAIKKRSTLTEEERAAKIAAFGDAATPQTDARAETPEPASAAPAAKTPRTTRAAPAADTEAGESVAPTTLIRWGKDKELRAEIGQIAKQEDRSVHAMILRLLRDGIDAYHSKH